ncbi:MULTISPECIES: hypothetical protein [Myxococcus]|uniref:Uncharacterized protein n=1 Tax=Myxococcus llanfairpwllgwyngyllgogerychwyrndrobwllllantysiliogogogochensis TaxID=2590453 RepID=A0A540X0Z6_9BACT|nr:MULTISPECIES: hypothetical protein [Myxococcus]NTX07236.1 hypothetical protein [Myxococcus sp. CA040A]NTX17270.1 hypothetical protein [Myxococcus sp. CA056]NTX41667.1 hypothetical protein [Myxococcus sp. CA033]TQF14925.1 hypothetical protein FJV41_16195 [Myxococcus llanfairpwllgwyngyllgogerychwyrndrobwllllantysiliogogogochensis]
MSETNGFAWEGTCPSCHVEVRVIFRSHVGLLDDQVFERGEDVFGRETNKKHPVHAPRYELRSGSFWAYGVDACPHCLTELWSRVFVRNGRYESLVLTTPPEDPLFWDEL